VSTFEQQVDQVRRALLAAHRNGTDVGEMLAEAIRQAELALHEQRNPCLCEIGARGWGIRNYRHAAQGVCRACGEPDSYPGLAEEVLTNNRPGSWEAEGVRSLIHGWHWGTRFDTNPATQAVAS
jgi:hypothetical protein